MCIWVLLLFFSLPRLVCCHFLVLPPLRLDLRCLAFGCPLCREAHEEACKCVFHCSFVSVSNERPILFVNIFRLLDLCKNRIFWFLPSFCRPRFCLLCFFLCDLGCRDSTKLKCVFPWYAYHLKFDSSTTCSLLSGDVITGSHRRAHGRPCF